MGYKKIKKIRTLTFTREILDDVDQLRIWSRKLKKRTLFSRKNATFAYCVWPRSVPAHRTVFMDQQTTLRKKGKKSTEIVYVPMRVPYYRQLNR